MAVNKELLLELAQRAGEVNTRVEYKALMAYFETIKPQFNYLEMQDVRDILDQTFNRLMRNIQEGSGGVC